MNPELLKCRLRDLQVTLRQIGGSIPETSGELRAELERQYEDVQAEIAKVMAHAGLVGLSPRSSHSRVRIPNRLHR
jgi:hypothetical protein